MAGLSDPLAPGGSGDGARMRAVLVLAATLAFVASPLAAPGFGGFRLDQFPALSEKPPLQPSGWAFSIWGVIYVWLAVSAVYGLFLRAEARGWDGARPWMLASLVAGAAWLPVAMTSPAMATVLIWVMLAGALGALVRASHGPDPWLQAAPIGLYAGWLTAATSLSSVYMIAGYGLMAALPASWAGLGLALAIGAGMVWRWRVHPAYGAALVWALAGVAVANAARPALAVAALAGAAILGALLWWRR